MRPQILELFPRSLRMINSLIGFQQFLAGFGIKGDDFISFLKENGHIREATGHPYYFQWLTPSPLESEEPVEEIVAVSSEAIVEFARRFVETWGMIKCFGNMTPFLSRFTTHGELHKFYNYIRREGDPTFNQIFNILSERWEFVSIIPSKDGPCGLLEWKMGRFHEIVILTDHIHRERETAENYEKYEFYDHARRVMAINLRDSAFRKSDLVEELKRGFML